MNVLIARLHQDKCSCVIRNQVIRTFNRRGIDDFYQLLKEEPETLMGAEVADRVIGKAIAAIMVKGGVRRVYADLISLSALILLRNAGISTDYQQLVTYIKNRRHTGWCPVEAMCYNGQTVDEIMPIIDRFAAQKSKYFNH